MTSLKDMLLTDLTFAHDRMLDMVRDYPEDRLLFQSAPTDGHLLWTLGHLAVTDVWFASVLVGSEQLTFRAPESWEALFAFGSVISPEASTYPGFPEVRAAFDNAHEAFVDIIVGLDEEGLVDPGPGVRSKGFIANAASGAMRKFWHDGWHTGQISSLRKALKLPSVFGG